MPESSPPQTTTSANVNGSEDLKESIDNHLKYSQAKKLVDLDSTGSLQQRRIDGA